MYPYTSLQRQILYMYFWIYIFKAANSKSQVSFVSYVSDYDIHLTAAGNQYFFYFTIKKAQISSERQLHSH